MRLPLCLLLLSVVLNPATLAAKDLNQPPSDPRAALIPFGSVAPEIAGLVLKGEPGTRLSSFRGKVVAVDFWATWCAPCIQSIPELNRMRNDLIAMGFADRFEVVSVNLDSDIPKARRFLEQYPVDYPVLGDPLSIAMKRFGAWKLPATFLLDGEGKVHMIWLGYADYFADDIKRLSLELLRDGKLSGG